MIKLKYEIFLFRTKIICTFILFLTFNKCNVVANYAYLCRTQVYSKVRLSGCSRDCGRIVSACQLLKAEKILPPPPLSPTISLNLPPIISFVTLSIMSVHCYENDLLGEITMGRFGQVKGGGGEYP